MKSGFYTTEFWLALIAQLLGFAGLIGWISPEQSSAIGEGARLIISGAVMIASALGYVINRSKVKRLAIQKGLAV